MTMFGTLFDRLRVRPGMTALAALLLSVASSAQVRIDQLYFDTRTTFHQEVADGQYYSQFTGDHFNLNIRGQLGGPELPGAAAP